MKTNHLISLIAMLLFGAFILTACGGNEADAPVELNVEGKDTFQFTPDTATIPAGTEVTLTFKNAGNLEHNLTIATSEINPLGYQEAEVLENTNTGTVPAGEEAKLTFKAPAPGNYTYFCVIPGHAAAGMVGTLTVTGAQVSNNN